MNVPVINDSIDRDDAIVANALSHVGIVVEGVYDLVNSANPYPEAYAILAELLPKVQDDRIKEGIARALTIRDARKDALHALVSEFKRISPKTESQMYVKWSIGNAIAEMVIDGDYQEIAELLEEESHGWPRSALISGLLRMKNHKDSSRELLVRLLDDRNLTPVALAALVRLKATGIDHKLQSLLNDPDKTVQKNARKLMTNRHG